MNYAYPGISKEISIGEGVENNLSIPILEVVRETPGNVGNYTEFESNLIIYNKGCGTASSISFVETTSTGWTAYGQTLDGVAAGTANIPQRQISFASSDFGTILEGEYKVISYSLLSNLNQEVTGEIRYNLSWGERNEYEDEAFEIMKYLISEETCKMCGKCSRVCPSGAIKWQPRNKASDVGFLL